MRRGKKAKQLRATFESDQNAILILFVTNNDHNTLFGNAACFSSAFEGLRTRSYTGKGGLSLSDESFPNGGARGAFAKPPWVWLKPSRSLREAFAKPSRRLLKAFSARDVFMKRS